MFIVNHGKKIPQRIFALLFVNICNRTYVCLNNELLNGYFLNLPTSPPTNAECCKMCIFFNKALNFKSRNILKFSARYPFHISPKTIFNSRFCGMRVHPL